eukprot:m.58121 g.58121  ORF g.58121 m.58121 type:complete len:196 (+) comp17190_c0_seq2:193-780(+)
MSAPTRRRTNTAAGGSPARTASPPLMTTPTSAAAGAAGQAGQPPTPHKKRQGGGKRLTGALKELAEKNGMGEKAWGKLDAEKKEKLIDKWQADLPSPAVKDQGTWFWLSKKFDAARKQDNTLARGVLDLYEPMRWADRETVWKGRTDSSGTAAAAAGGGVLRMAPIFEEAHTALVLALIDPLPVAIMHSLVHWVP